MLQAVFHATPLGSLCIAIAETMLVVALPNGDLAVFGPADSDAWPGSVVPAAVGQGFEHGVTEVSWHSTGQGAHYAACGDVLAIALEDI